MTSWQCGGRRVDSILLMNSMEFFKYDLQVCVRGCKNLSNNAEGVSVGPSLHATIGLMPIGFLCNFGRKYMYWIFNYIGKGKESVRHVINGPCSQQGLDPSGKSTTNGVCGVMIKRFIGGWVIKCLVAKSW